MRSIIGVVLVLASVGVSACAGDKSGGGGPTTPTTTQTRIIGLSGNLAFGNVQVGSSATASLTITNTGNAPLAISSMSITSGLGSVFATSFTSGSISPGGSQPVTIQFAPTAGQTYTGSITVNGDQTSGTNSIGISGTGVLQRANFQLASTTGLYICVTGLCTSFTYPIVNQGPGCGTNVQVITRFYGSDGSGPQLGVDVPMGLPGGSLSSTVFRPGTTVTVQNTIPFNDIRSAHTIFRSFITWTDVGC